VYWTVERAGNIFVDKNYIEKKGLDMPNVEWLIRQLPDTKGRHN